MPDDPSRCAGGCRRPPAEIAIRDKIRFLGNAENYPDRPGRIEIVETHFSWVFLTQLYAYKLKKPVQSDGFDFRTGAARRRNALAELRLNRRLAPDVYLAVVPLNLGPDARLSLGGAGEPVDWLVKMVRLDVEHMLDRRLAAGNWRYAELEALADRLAAFFASARRVRISAPHLRARLVAEIEATQSSVARAGEAPLVAISLPTLRRLRAFVGRRPGLFGRRIAEHRIVDGHGDLRPEHVYLKGTPRVIDCLEFREDLRQLDPVNEIAYFALECRRLGGPVVEPRLLRRYRRRTGDRPPRELVRFYSALNALVRARIAVEHLAEPGTRPPQAWIDRAAGYLAAAAKETAHLRR